MDSEFEQKIFQFMGRTEITEKIREMRNRNLLRLSINLNSVREFSEQLYNYILKSPINAIPHFESQLKALTSDSSNRSQKNTKSYKIGVTKKQDVSFKITFEGVFGKNMVSPRGLTSVLSNQLVCVQGIVTRMSVVRPKLVNSAHYCDETRNGFIKEYSDQFSLSTENKVTGEASFVSNTIPIKDINNNSLSFEYGFSTFRDFQILLVQEPPERTPVGQLPRSVEIVLEDDLVDKIKPGDRIQLVGVFKCVPTKSTTIGGVFRTVVIASSIFSMNDEAESLKLSGYELGQIKNISKREDCLDLLANSFAPSIYGSEYIKKACILQLLGGSEKNLDNGTHLRGDINILLIGDPSTAKSQILRHMLSTAHNAINTTGRGSSGVGLTAAVVIDKDTGERHLEAGAMVLGDRGLVCIDEFDKMNDLDRVAIHEVMEQQTVTIAKAGIHCSLNARCSVLAAANPIYGEYQKDIPAAKNIGLPDSLLSRFDLVFIVLDEESSELDRLIADRVVRNHMYPSDTPTLLNVIDNKIIEPDLGSEINEDTHEIFEKYNSLLHGKIKKDILKKQFLKKFIQYAKIGPNKSPPILSDEAAVFITNSWTKLRNIDEELVNKFRAVPITVRTLETLIRLSTAHAKLRLAKAVTKLDCEIAMELLSFALFHEKPENRDFVEMLDEEKLNNTHSKEEKNGIDKNKKINDLEKDSSSKKKQKLSKSKKIDEEINSIENIFESRLNVDSKITEDHKKFLFKIIYNLNKKERKQIDYDHLWEETKKISNYKDYCKTKSDMLDIILSLDNDGKIIYSPDAKEITLI